MAVVIRWTTRGKKNAWYRPKYYTNSFHLRVAHPPRRRSFCHGRMLYKKPRVPSTRREAHLHVSHETTTIIPRECPEDSLRPENFFMRDIPNLFVYRNNTQNWHIYQKINLYSLSPTFQIHCSSSYAQVVYHFLFVVVLLKGEQRLLEKRETQRISTPIRIRSRIFLTRHVTSRYCFTHFQKWKSSGLLTNIA